jgi:hypothetical protein
MNEDDFVDLIEKDLSGRISEDERRRLQAYLDEHEEARDIHRKMTETCEVLNKVRDIEPPAGMKRRIMDSIDPRLHAARPARGASIRDVLLGPRLRLAYVFAFGLAIGLVIYSVMPGVWPGGGREDVGHLYGTIAGGDHSDLSGIDRASVDRPDVTGEILLLKAGSILVIEPELRSDRDLGFIVEFDPARFRFEGVCTVNGADMRVVSRGGRVTVSGIGAGRYVLTMLDADGPAALSVQVLISGSSAYRHEFTVAD